MKTTCIIVLVTIIIISLIGCERSILYRTGQTTIADVKKYVADNGLKMWPEKTAYQGIITKAGPGNSKGTIVIFHGNGGPAMYRKFYFAALEPRGYRVVLIEYPGYGGRHGEMDEKSFVDDARCAVLQAKKDFGGPLYLWGESMGCGVAADLAKDAELNPSGVALITPWDSLADEARSKFPLLPYKFLLGDAYDNAANLTGFKGPVAVIMAKKDEVIPNRLTEKLYNKLSQPKRMWTFENAGHTDWPSDPGLEWWTEVMDFLSSGK